MGLKILYPETQASLVATSEAVDYPVENLLDNKIKKAWRASSGETSATVTVTTSGGDDCVAMFGIVADSAVVTVKDAGGSTVSTHSFNLNAGDSRSYNRFWVEYETRSSAHNIEIALAKANGQIEAGVVRTGTMVDLQKNPKYDVPEQRKDKSIMKDLSNGALYVRKRSIQRLYNPQLRIDRAKWYELTDLYDANGPLPLAILLLDGDEDRQWSIFGHMHKPTEGSHQRLSRVNCSIPILEAV